jgi:CubicO group peptidase (beta-lactamase class C family)
MPTILCGLLLFAGSSRADNLQRLDQLTTRLDQTIPDLLAKHHTPGLSLALVRSRELACDRHYGILQAGTTKAVDSEAIFEAASMSKPLFALGVMKLAEEKKLDLDRPLVNYLAGPYLPDEPLHQKITARMVLSHSSGFPNWRKGGWRAGGPLPVAFEPGSKYGYSGEGFWYLQQVAEQITGERMEPWMQRTVLGPLGMTQSSFVWRDVYEKRAAAGHDREGKVKTTGKRFDRENAAFSLFTTPADYARCLISMMPDDNEPSIFIKRESLATMLRPAQATDKPQVWRGLGWAITKQDKKIFAWHTGTNATGFQCYSRFTPATGDGLVIMTNGLGGDAVWKSIVESVDAPSGDSLLKR